MLKCSFDVALRRDNAAFHIPKLTHSADGYVEDAVAFRAIAKRKGNELGAMFVDIGAISARRVNPRHVRTLKRA